MPDQTSLPVPASPPSEVLEGDGATPQGAAAVQPFRMSNWGLGHSSVHT